MKYSNTIIASVALALLGGLATPARANVYNIGASGLGVISGNTGGTSSGNADVGYWGGRDNRGFRVYNIPTLAPNEQIISATYKFFYDDYFSVDNWEQIDFHSYEGSIANLLNGSAGMSGYADLGNGASYGGFTFNLNGNPPVGSWVNIFLGSAIADINASAGSLWAFGLSLGTYNGGATETIGFGGGAGGMHTLVLETAFIPAPGAMALLGISGLIGRRRRRA